MGQKVATIWFIFHNFPGSVCTLANNSRRACHTVQFTADVKQFWLHTTPPQSMLPGCQVQIVARNKGLISQLRFYYLTHEDMESSLWYTHTGWHSWHCPTIVGL